MPPLVLQASCAMALIPQGMIAEGGGPLTIVACGLWLQLRPRERGLPLRRGHRARRRERRAHSPRVTPNKQGANVQAGRAKDSVCHIANFR